MARDSRQKSKTGIYHVMLRGVNRQSIFEDLQDRNVFLDLLKNCKEANYYLHAYCLMDNHVHLLLQEVDQDISMSIKRVSGRYAQWYNNKYERCGHLFQERFRSEVVENDAYFLTVLRYIHQNPIQIGMSEHINNIYWTSYSEYITSPTIINTDFGLGLFSEIHEQAKRKFIAFHLAESQDYCMEYTDKNRLTDIEARNKIIALGIDDLSMISALPKEEKYIVLRTIKEIEGITDRQISRLTGISKSLISNIRKMDMGRREGAPAQGKMDMGTGTVSI